MKIVKLFSQNATTIGKTVTLPVVGDVTFDSEENFIEVPENKVEDLLSQDFGISLVEEEKSKDLEKEKEKIEYQEMLAALSDEEIEDLLSSHSLKNKKALKTRQEKIDYLVSKL